MLTYDQAAELFATARDDFAGKPLANNTRLQRRGDLYAIRLHNTDVVTILPGDRYMLTASHWQTVTTKDRINAWSPARVYSDRGTWYVYHRTNGADPRPEYVAPRQPGRREYLAANREWQDRNRTAFYDGIVVDADGMPIDTPTVADAARAWCKEHGLRVRDGHVTLWKAVDASLTSRHGTTYTPRTRVVDRFYRRTAECGNGLHFGPTPAVAAKYHGENAVLLKCRVPLDTLVPLADKCKARECYVIGRASA